MLAMNEHECPTDYYIYIEREGADGYISHYEKHALLTSTEAEQLEAKLKATGKYKTIDVDLGGDYYTVGLDETFSEIEGDLHTVEDYDEEDEEE